MSRAGRIADAAAIVIAAGAAIYMTLRRPVFGVNDLLPGGRQFAAIGIGVALIVTAGLLLAARRGALVRVLARVVLFGAAGLLACIALGRAKTLRWEKNGMAVAVWPPRPEDSRAARLETLKPAERASWGARVAAHWLVDSLVFNDAVTIPEGWPFPDDVELTIRYLTPARAQIWSRAGDGTTTCLPIPSRAAAADSIGQLEACEKARMAPAGLQFARPQRVPSPVPALRETVAGSPWQQYRRDPEKSGAAATGSTFGAWRAQLDGPGRTAPSAAGSLVLVGAHGTGDFEALDVATGKRRWSARLPNWVHQDAVSDGRVVVVGFGSDWPSFAGREPSGVAAYELETGRHLWTAFEESSVMTSPVIFDSMLIYASAAGVLRKRGLRSGALVGEHRLPGGVIMGPPAILGDTLVVGLDANGVCAILASTLKPLWCKTFTGLRLMGHTAPTIAGGAAIVSGAGLLRSLSFKEFRSLSFALQRKLLTTAFGPEGTYASQDFMSLDLRDGHVHWKSRAFPATRAFKGQISGTAAVSGNTAVIVLPLSDSLVAFDAPSGNVLWAAAAHGARGAPSIIGDQVILGGGDGVIEVRELASGKLTCSLRRSVGFDRAGPTYAGNLFIFANLQGMVEAIPRDDLLQCRAR